MGMGNGGHDFVYYEDFVKILEMCAIVRRKGC